MTLIFMATSFKVGNEQGFPAQFASIAPNTLSSLRIFFTFLGIVISVSNLDVGDMSDLTPRLLKRLK